MPYCCVPYKYPGYRSHYPKRCLHLTMNECQRKFPQMWHSRRLPFHNKDNCRSHSNRWLYSFQGSGEQQNIAKSRLINYSTFKIHKLHCRRAMQLLVMSFFLFNLHLELGLKNPLEIKSSDSAAWLGAPETMMTR